MIGPPSPFFLTRRCIDCINFFIHHLVNNVIFKAGGMQEKQPEVQEKQPEQSSTLCPSVSDTSKSQLSYEQKKQEPTQSNRWKAPWLNIQRNKQRHDSSDNVIRPFPGVSRGNFSDAASILKNKLDAKSSKGQYASLATESSSVPAQTSHKCLSGKIWFFGPTIHDPYR